MDNVHYKRHEHNPPYATPERDDPLPLPRGVIVTRSILNLSPHQIKIYLAVRFLEKTAIIDRDGLWCMLTQDAIAKIAGYSGRQWVGEVIKSLVLDGYMETTRVPGHLGLAYRTRGVRHDF